MTQPNYSGPLSDRLEIRELIETYGDAVFRRDLETWMSCWAEDAVWAIPGVEVHGAGEIRAAWMRAIHVFTLTAYFPTPASIRVDGDRATSRVYTQEILIDHAGDRRLMAGVYEDELARTPDGWRFKRRAYSILDDRTVNERAPKRVSRR